MTDAEAIDQFRRALRAIGRSDSTIDHYIGATKQFAEFCPYPIVRASRGDIEDWIVALRGQGYASKTVLNRWKGLAAFYRWLVQEEEIETSPMARMKQPAVEETRKDVVGEDRLRELFAHLSKHRRWRDAAMIAILYDTAMRASELANTPLDALDRDTGLITIEATRTKAKRFRVVRLSPTTLTYVDRYMRQRKKRGKEGQWLIEGQRGKMGRSGLWDAVQTAFREIGLPGISPHDLRHTAATHVVGEWGESEMMTYFGWSSSEMVRHYAKQALQDAALAAHKRASPMERLGK